MVIAEIQPHERPPHNDLSPVTGVPYPLSPRPTQQISSQLKKDIRIHLERVSLPESYQETILGSGADPYIFSDPRTHQVALTYTSPRLSADESQILLPLHTAPSISKLATEAVQIQEIALPITQPFPSLEKSSGVWTVESYQKSEMKYNQEVWAQEIHYINGVYEIWVAISDGNNSNHRMLRYRAPELTGPYQFVEVIADNEKDYWAIDGTHIKISNQNYMIYSGWEELDSQMPQHLYIMGIDTYLPRSRTKIASPTLSWCTTMAPIMEGPQVIEIDGKVLGLTFAADASWTTAYTTSVLWLVGENPLLPSSWVLDKKPLFPSTFGMGHGMFFDDPEDGLFFVTHRKTLAKPGWEDRWITAIPYNKETLYSRYTQALSETIRQRYHSLQGLRDNN